MAPYMIPVDTNMTGPAEAMGGIGNMLMQAAQEKRLREQQASEMLMRQQEAQQRSEQHAALMAERQRQLHGQALEEAMQNKDNPAMLQMIGQKYGLPFSEMGQGGPAPRAPTSPMSLGMGSLGMGGGSPAPQQESPPVQPQSTPMAQPQGMSLDDLLAIDPSTPRSPTVTVKEPITITAGNSVPSGEDEHLDYSHQLLTQESRVKDQADRVEQYQQAEQAVKNGAVPGKPSPVYQMGPYTIDTGALKAGEETSKANRLKRYQVAFADNPDALKLATQYTHLGASEEFIQKALLESGKIDQRTEGRLRMLETNLDAKAQTEADRERARLELERLQQSGGKYAHTAGAGGATTDANGNPIFNPKVEAANRLALNAFKRDTVQWATKYGIPQISKGVSGLDETEAMLKSGNPTAAAAGLERFVAVSRSGTGNGAAATNAALALFQQHMGGIADTVEGGIEKLRSGKLGEGQVLNLIGAVKTAKEALKASANPLHQSFVDSYYNDGYSNIKHDVENQEEALFGPLGYHPQRDPNAKGIKVLSGQAPSALRQGGGQGQSGGAERKSDTPAGGATPSVSPAEQQLYQKALEAVKDPNSSPSRKANAQRYIEDIQSRLQRM